MASIFFDFRGGRSRLLESRGKWRAMTSLLDCRWWSSDNDVKMHTSNPQMEWFAEVWVSALRPKKADWRKVRSATGVRRSDHLPNILHQDRVSFFEKFSPLPYLGVDPLGLVRHKVLSILVVIISSCSLNQMTRAHYVIYRLISP